MRAFADAHLGNMERGASEEVAQLCAEVRRLYAEEDARTRTEAALQTLLSSTHQQLHASARTLEGALRMVAPPQAPQGVRQQKQMPPVMGGGEPKQDQG